MTFQQQYGTSPNTTDDIMETGKREREGALSGYKTMGLFDPLKTDTCKKLKRPFKAECGKSV